jgi:hypothetical protein
MVCEGIIVNSFAGNLLPQRLRAVVPHDQITVAQESGDAESLRHAIDDAIEYDRTVAERAIRDRDLLATDHGINDLVRSNMLRGKARAWPLISTAMTGSGPSSYSGAGLTPT